MPSVQEIPDEKGLIEIANTFVYEGSGFYSEYDADMYSEDFVFRGPTIGPLNKKDYLATMDTFKLYEALPDINPNAFGYHIDPRDSNRVWFMVRNTGTFTGKPIGLGIGNLSVPPNGAKIEGCAETFSIIFDKNKKVKHLTVGYVADRFEGNTMGSGAALGIFRAVGLPIPNSGPMGKLVRVLGDLAGGTGKTFSRELPSWWKSTEIGPDGYD